MGISLTTRKLHLGCGTHLLEGWINTDGAPRVQNVLRLDVTKPFPFSENEFDFIFSEHMIEHLDFKDGLFMLSECFRVLKPGGRVRISTPSLDFLIGLYTNPENDLNRRYINWSLGVGIPDAVIYDPVFVVNNFVRNWGHKFIYNEKILTLSLVRAGFISIEYFLLGQSNASELRKLECENRMPSGFLQLETMTAEGVKLA